MECQQLGRLERSKEVDVGLHEGERTAHRIDLPLMPEKPKDVRFNDLEGVLAEVKSTGWED